MILSLDLTLLIPARRANLSVFYRDLLNKPKNELTYVSHPLRLFYPFVLFEIPDTIAFYIT